MMDLLVSDIKQNLSLPYSYVKKELKPKIDILLLYKMLANDSLKLVLKIHIFCSTLNIQMEL